MNCITKETKKIIALLILTVMVLAMGLPGEFTCAQAATPSDIDGHWASEAINAWIEQGFINGYEDGTFKPDNSISRAEFAALVNRSFKFEETSTISFTDVKEGDWYYNDIAKAKKAEYLSGYEDQTVRPDASITREEVATIIAKLKTLAASEEDTSSFTDAASISSWSKGYVGAVVKAKYMKGYDDGSFGPAKKITRAEAVYALNNVIGITKVSIEAISDKSVKVGSTTKVTVKANPSDAKLAIKNSDDKIVTATLNDSEISLKGVKTGSANITVTAEKDGLDKAELTFKVTVSAASSGGGGGGGSSSPSNERPVITITWPDGTHDLTKTIKVGDSFVEPTAKATDKEDGNISNKIVKTGSVDATKVGAYELKYNVKDSKNLAATEIKVTVNVVAKTIEAKANITVEIAKDLPTFKKIIVNSATAGAKFKVEGSELVNAFGNPITVNTSADTRIVYILDDNGNVIGTITVDVSTAGTKDYTFTVQEVADKKANITVVIAKDLPTFKKITVNSATVGAKFKVAGSELVNAFGNPITVNTSADTRIVYILDADSNVLGTITVDVKSASTQDYEIQTNGGGGAIPANNKPVITVVEPDGSNDGVITLIIGATFVAPVVTANDAEDGDITSRIVKAGEELVDTSKAGEYVVTYNVTDQNGLAADESKVTVKVLADISGAKANIKVDIAKDLPSFKKITVNSATVGAKFKVEGSSSIKAFGESITVNTGEATRTVYILDADGNELGTVTINVGSNSISDYALE